MRRRHHLFLNHLENMRGLTTKTGLIQSLRRYYDLNKSAIASNYGVFDTTPTTYIIIAGSEDSNYFSFMKRFKQLLRHQNCSEKMPIKHCQQNLWLVKPANLNQGRLYHIYIYIYI